MTRYGRVGFFGQVAHPRIRGGLDPTSGNKTHYNHSSRPEDFKTDEEEMYFVPSFSIRRHLHNDEELLWNTNQRFVQRRLGRGFKALAPADITIKTIEQKRFIKAMRDAGVRPEPDEVRDLAYALRDDLTNMLANAHSPLNLPLGSFGRFGQGNNVVAYQIEGWHGDRAHYGENDSEGFMDDLAVVHAERKLAVGAIALAFSNMDFRAEDFISSPHVTIARGKGEIPDDRMRSIRGELADVAIGAVDFGDPVIEMKLYRDMPSESIYVKHAWESLGYQSKDLASSGVAGMAFEPDYDHYDELASRSIYA